MKNLTVYTLPGLALDSRIFEKISIPNVNLIHLNWIEPFDDNESIQDYAKRFCTQFMHHEGEIVLIGHSFGGVLAQEISKITTVNHIFLLSSIIDEVEKPIIFEHLFQTGLYKWMTPFGSWLTVPFWGFIFDYQSVAHLRLFQKMILSKSYRLFRWSFKTLFSWKSDGRISTVMTRIHGTDDKTFHINRMKHMDYIIQNGGHFMVYKKADEINSIIQNELFKK